MFETNSTSTTAITKTEGMPAAKMIAHISLSLSAVLGFQPGALGVGPGQPVGRESADGLGVASAGGPRRCRRDFLRLPAIPRLGLPVLRPGPVGGRPGPRADAPSRRLLRPRALPERALLPRDPSVREGGVVGRHAFCALPAQVLHGDQRRRRWLRNHVLPRRHSR